MTTRHRRLAASDAHAIAANDAAPRLVTMAELLNMETDIHGSRIIQQPDRDFLMLGCRCVAYSMRAVS